MLRRCSCAIALAVMLVGLPTAQAVKEQLAAIQWAILLALVPPAFVLALGSALVWALKGFLKLTQKLMLAAVALLIVVATPVVAEDSVLRSLPADVQKDIEEYRTVPPAGASAMRHWPSPRTTRV
jgi:hypothetical protein